MYKRYLALALCLAWAHDVQAFPPCPKDPVNLIEAGDEDDSNTPLLFKGVYAMVGDPSIIDTIKPPNKTDPRDPHGTGQCRPSDLLPVPENNQSPDSIGFGSTYAARSGFGIIALPELRRSEGDIGVEYTLSFTMDSNALPNSDEWFDVAQLEFQWNDWPEMKYPDSLAAAYRVRKRQYGKTAPVIEVIQVRTPWGGPHTKPPVSEHIVATIPIDMESKVTAITLRWTQRTDKEAISANEPEGPSTAPYFNVDSTFEVLGPELQLLYSTALPARWASNLSMGLLNYNVSKVEDYVSGYGVELGAMTLKATEF